MSQRVAQKKLYDCAGIFEVVIVAVLMILISLFLGNGDWADRQLFPLAISAFAFAIVFGLYDAGYIAYLECHLNRDPVVLFVIGLLGALVSLVLALTVFRFIQPTYWIHMLINGLISGLIGGRYGVECALNLVTLVLPGTEGETEEPVKPKKRLQVAGENAIVPIVLAMVLLAIIPLLLLSSNPNPIEPYAIVVCGIGISLLLGLISAGFATYDYPRPLEPSTAILIIFVVLAGLLSWLSDWLYWVYIQSDCSLLIWALASGVICSFLSFVVMLVGGLILHCISEDEDERRLGHS